MPDLKPCRLCKHNRKCFNAHHHLIDSMLRDRLRRILFDGKPDCFASTCGQCNHYTGCGDWDLCCGLQKRRLCYDDSESCESFESKDFGGNIDG